MYKVFISGAMSSDNIFTICNNIHEGIKLGNILIDKGYSPYIPHLDIFIKIQCGVNLNISIQKYYDYVMEWLKVCDYILVCPNYKNSVGVAQELEKAKELNIPIFYDINELESYVYVKEHKFDELESVQKYLQDNFEDASLIVNDQGVQLKCKNLCISTKSI